MCCYAQDMSESLQKWQRDEVQYWELQKQPHQANTVVIIVVTSTTKSRMREQTEVGWPPHCSISFVVYTMREEITREAICPRPSNPLIRVAASIGEEDSISVLRPGSSWSSNETYYSQKETPFHIGIWEILNSIRKKTLDFVWSDRIWFPRHISDMILHMCWNSPKFTFRHPLVLTIWISFIIFDILLHK